MYENPIAVEVNTGEGAIHCGPFRVAVLKERV
jgi:hypothetical protein